MYHSSQKCISLLMRESRYGQLLGPAQGVGWVNELIARLTNTPVQDHTDTNRTLDSSAATFPLNRSMYADFSHDDEIIAIVSAIGLFRQPTPLDPTKPNSDRTWRASSIVPFSGRVVVERLSCDVRAEAKGAEENREARVRILVQDEVQPLVFCGGDEYRMCTLSAFVQRQSFARGNGDGDFEKCQAGSTNSSRQRV